VVRPNSSAKAFSLMPAEALQVINLAPAAPVEIHLIVEQCADRLTDDQVGGEGCEVAVIACRAPCAACAVVRRVCARVSKGDV
jgi:hypothetical protein